MEENKQTLDKSIFHSQVRYMIGFMLCIVLAAFSFWAAVFSGYSYKIVFAGIALLAFTQAIIRLFQLDPSQSDQ